MRIFRILLFCIILQFSAQAQSKQKAEAAFVAGLNNIITNSTQQHWAYDGQKMTIDSGFAINKEGVLSVTISYTSDSVVTITRTEAPVNKIRRVAYDLYLILEFKDDDVSSYATDDGSMVLKATGKGNLFHIGAPLPEDTYHQVRLQKLLDNLLKYYRK